METTHLVGLDLGDPGRTTAVAVVERTKGPDPEGRRRSSTHYAVRHLERFTPGASFPAVLERTAALCREPTLRRPDLVVDYTGVGLAVARQFRSAGIRAAVRPLRVGGGKALHDQGGWKVARLELIATLQLLLQTRRLTVAQRLPQAGLFVQELLGFKMKPPPANAESLDAWREGPQDDLVFAVAVAAWYGENCMREFDMW